MYPILWSLEWASELFHDFFRLWFWRRRAGFSWAKFQKEHGCGRCADGKESGIMILVGKTRIQLGNIPEGARSRLERNLEWRKAISSRRTRALVWRKLWVEFRLKLRFFYHCFSYKDSFPPVTSRSKIEQPSPPKSEPTLSVRCEFYSLQLMTCTSTYVRILRSWANHCEHEIIIPSTTRRYWVTSGCWLMVDELLFGCLL